MSVIRAAAAAAAAAREYKDRGGDGKVDRGKQRGRCLLPPAPLVHAREREGEREEGRRGGGEERMKEKARDVGEVREKETREEEREEREPGSQGGRE